MTSENNLVQIYQTITSLLFRDKVNRGRLCVLDMYTKAVCRFCSPYASNKIIIHYFIIKQQQEEKLHQYSTRYSLLKPMVMFLFGFIIGLTC